MHKTNHSQHYTDELKRLEEKYSPIQRPSVDSVARQMRGIKDRCQYWQRMEDRYKDKIIKGDCSKATLANICIICESLGACIKRFNDLQEHYNKIGFSVLAYRNTDTAVPYKVEVYAPNGDGYLKVG
jgi:hypothetical protein